jgi:CPA2 family monovalent cation:H+ antiporter-2
LQLDALNLSLLGAEITAVRRGKIRIPFSPETVLEAGDVVVLRGNAESIELAEKRLLQRPN